MKRFILFAALLATLSPLTIHTAQANSATINLAPGVSLQLGDRDNRGHYWDGGRWRDGRWWNQRYRYDDRRWQRNDDWRRQQWQREHRRADWRPDPYPRPDRYERRDRYERPDRHGGPDRWRGGPDRGYDRHHDRRGPPDWDRHR